MVKLCMRVAFAIHRGSSHCLGSWAEDQIASSWMDMLILGLANDLLWVIVQIDVTMSVHEALNSIVWHRHHDFCLKKRSTSSIPRLKTPVRASTSAICSGPALMISLVI